MGYPARLLSEGENVVLDMHPHWKRLVLPVLSLVVVLALAGYLLALVDDGRLQVVVAVAAVVLLVEFTVVPFLRWRTTLFVVTNRRVVVRTGVLARQGRDVPLSRINDITFSHSLFERLLGCGTLVVESAGERGQVVLTEVPQVEQVQRTLYDLVEQVS
mgnify:CR=1 FL=1